MIYRIPKRNGFTLVELMVAAALSLVIMTIMALAFQSAMATLSNLKSVGDQADRLRTAEVMLRADLDSDHMVIDDGGNTAKVGDLRYDDLSKTPTVKGGYFSVTTVIGTNEGIDSDSIISTSSNGATNSLTMTVKRTSKTPADLFGTAAGGGVGKVSDTLGANDNSPWAEVKWQLSPTPRLTVGATAMYSLHRTVRVLNVNGSSNLPPTTPTLAALSPAIATGDDIVLTNVVSFEVKPLLVNFSGTPVGAALDPPYADTGWTTAPSATTRCVAVLVKIRLYDVKTKLTRQMSLIVKL
jgi:prepilin-type N-terminal cleavage/methylation domain-containing protein